MMIFDAIGNLVYSRKNDQNLTPQDWYSSNKAAGDKEQLVLYWNGITDYDKKASPGIYRAIAILKINGEVRKHVGNIGIGR